MIKYFKDNKQSLMLNAFYLFSIGLLWAGTYEQAHANLFDNLGQAILDILNNTFLRVLAIIAVIVVGIRALKGQMDWSTAIFVIIAIVIIFGAAGIVDFIIDNAGTL